MSAQANPTSLPSSPPSLTPSSLPSPDPDPDPIKSHGFLAASTTSPPSAPNPRPAPAPSAPADCAGDPNTNCLASSFRGCCAQPLTAAPFSAPSSGCPTSCPASRSPAAAPPTVPSADCLGVLCGVRSAPAPPPLDCVSSRALLPFSRMICSMIVCDDFLCDTGVCRLPSCDVVEPSCSDPTSESRLPLQRGRVLRLPLRDKARSPGHVSLPAPPISRRRTCRCGLRGTHPFLSTHALAGSPVRACCAWVSSFVRGNERTNARTGVGIRHTGHACGRWDTRD